MANFSETQRSVWAYADTGCTEKFIFMCRNISERPRSRRDLAAAALQRCFVPAVMAFVEQHGR